MIDEGSWQTPNDWNFHGEAVSSQGFTKKIDDVLPKKCVDDAAEDSNR